ncbi:BcsE family c-di-GMP-binding protein [Undibacterium sp. JH2W]|uniref:BcsE family c-di-GMP-binding protein n=1 Tax=Undibacterium sp. JH2W TaxID=3413037 RepID=UPI003BEF87C6
MHESTVLANASLSIPGLPSLTDQMLNGGLYALIAEMPPARVPVLASSLQYAWSKQQHCTIILPSHPEAFLERIDALGVYDTSRALESGKLQIFLRQDNFAKNMFRFGPERFVKELDHFGIQDDSYLIFDQADELFSLHDLSLAMEQIEALRLWFGKHRVTALLVFSRLSGHSAETLQAMMDQLSGIVRISSGRPGLELTFDYWQSPEGTIAARQYPLLTLDNGMYRIGARTVEELPGQSAEYGQVAEARFFYMDEDLASLANESPGNWQQVNSLVGMLHATRGLQAVTVLLSFQRQTELRELAETVHTLRMSLGKKAHIVIREKQASLRYQNEALLLRLGVNLVIHRDIPESRLPLLLESLKGQSFDRNVDIDFEVALASVLPSGLRGYLLPPRFAREIGLIIERGAALSIPCVLVIGELVHGTSFPDILARVNISRPGDLLSSDGRACYLFFNACPEAALPLTLERILGAAAATAFHEVRYLTDRQDIVLALANLAYATKDAELPDYSSAISAMGEYIEAAESTEVAGPVVLKEDFPFLPKPHAHELQAVVPRAKVQLMQADMQFEHELSETATEFAMTAEEEEEQDFSSDTEDQFKFNPVAGSATRAASQVFGKQPAPRATRATYKKQPV